MKKIILLVLPILLLSCGWFSKKNKGDYLCPAIIVKQDTLRALNDTVELFLTGFEAHCYYNENTKSTWARITPAFKAVRLKHGVERDIFFAYYTETLIGPPEYLGRRTRHEKATLPEGMSETRFKGRTFEMVIPAGFEEHYSLNMGLIFSKKKKI